MKERVYCEKCNNLENHFVKKEERELQVRDILVKATISISYCEECGNEVYNRKLEMENDIIIFDEYKKAKGLLTAFEVKSIRENYGLSQKAFSQLLGFGEKTITRYENGAIQDATHDKYLRLLMNPENVFEIWNISKKELSSSINKKLDQIFTISKSDFNMNVVQTDYYTDNLKDVYFISERNGGCNYETE